jgi:hypothetical protein
MKRINQEWYDENRELFSGETTKIEDKLPKKCKHYFVKQSAGTTGCRDCTNEWRGTEDWIVKDGRVTIRRG